jgi:hypothetical protein
VRGGERPQAVPLNLLSGSAQDANVLTSIIRTRYRTVPVMAEQFVWSARMLSRWYVLVPDVSVVSGR